MSLVVAAASLFASLAPALAGAATPGEALDFDGSDDYVDLGENIAAQMTGQRMTLEGWVYLRGLTFYGTFAKNWGDSSTGAFHWGLEGTSQRQSFYVTQDSDGTVVGVVSPNPLPLNTWVHVAAVADGTMLRLYENGDEVAAAPYDGTLYTAFARTFLGAKPSDSGGAATDGYAGFLNGTLDEVTIWNVALTGAEVEESIFSDLTGTESGLVAYYKFNQGIAGGDNAAETTLIDKAGGDNNGTLQNFALAGDTSNWIAPGAPPPAPEIAIFGHGVEIASGDTTPSTADHTDFGGKAGTRTFTIANRGFLDLNLTGMPDKVTLSGPGASHFSVTAQPQSPVAAKNSTTFQVTFDPGTGGLHTATVTVESDDSDEMIYTFDILGGTNDVPIVVTTAEDTVADNDGVISLREAIALAESQPGADIITFDAAAFSTAKTIQLLTADDDLLGPSAFGITSDITIVGSTAGVTIARDGSVANLRLFYNRGGLTLKNLTLSNGKAQGGNGGDGGGGAAGLGGAILNRGTLDLTGVTLSGNAVQGGNGNASGSNGGGGGGGLGGNGGNAGAPFIFFYPFGAGGGGGGGGGNAGDGSNGRDGQDDGTGGNGGPTTGGKGGTGAYFTFLGPVAATPGESASGEGGGGGGGGYGGGDGGHGGFGGGGGNGPSATGGDGGFGGGGGGGSIAAGGRGFAGGDGDLLGAGGGGAGLGGAVFNDGGTVTATNSTLAGNMAAGGTGATGGQSFGGAIFNRNGALTVTNCTLSGNTADDGGTDIYNGPEATANLRIGNTILNTVAGSTLVNDTGTVTSLGYNLSKDDQSALLNQTTDQNTTDPVLDSNGLQNNGGPTKTIALQISPAVSPAIDKGKALGGVTTDQRGEVRTKDLSFPNAPGSDGTDIGAFEAGVSYIVTTKDDTEADDSVLSLREAIAAANANTAPSVVIFDATVFATRQAITLGGTPLPDITTNMSIIAPAAGLTVDAGNGSTIVKVLSGAVVSMEKLTFSNGNADNGGGGGAIGNGGTLTLTNCTLVGNHADTSFAGGGAIFNGSLGTLTLNNCTLTGNHAFGSGGGAIGNIGTLTVTNCTLTGNSADGASGGAIFNSGTASIGNSIVAGNGASGGSGPDLFGSFTSPGYNLIGDGTDASGFTSGTNGDQVGTTASPIDPKLFPLGDYGGPTPTHALAPDSPALDKGKALGGVMTDQRGKRRPADVNDSLYPNAAGGDGSDIGAFEVGNYVVTLLGDVTDDTDGKLTLREAIVAAHADSRAFVTFSNTTNGGAVNFYDGTMHTITLGGAAIEIRQLMTIIGPGADKVTVDANHASRIFYIAPLSAAISGLTMINGNSRGGAIYNDGSVAVSDCVLAGNTGDAGGGHLQRRLLQRVRDDQELHAQRQHRHQRWRHFQ